MQKEPYLKPEVKSETLEPEALANTGSPFGTGGNGDGDPCEEYC